MNGPMKPSVTAFVVDDEPLARRRLRDLIQGVPWLEFAGEAASSRAASRGSEKRARSPAREPPSISFMLKYCCPW